MISSNDNFEYDYFFSDDINPMFDQEQFDQLSEQFINENYQPDSSKIISSLFTQDLNSNHCEHLLSENLCQNNTLNNESTVAIDLAWLDLYDSSLYPSIFSPDNDNTHSSSTSSLLLLPHIADQMHITSTNDPVAILSSTTNAAAGIPNDTLEATTTTNIDCQSSSLNSLSSVVSMLMMGSIAEHDRPYAEYGHLDHGAIIRAGQFDMLGTKTAQKRALNKYRMSRQMYAITCCTNVSKEEIMREILRHFPISTFQYVCVSTDHFSSTTIMTSFRMIYIQIILTKVVNKHGWFLDQVTGDQCNYHVTENDLAWNEFIRRDRNFIETGTFKSKRIRSHHSDWSSSAFVRAQTKQCNNLINSSSVYR